MARYAASTEVNSDRSRAEIERILQRYGADSFLYGWDQQAAIVGFRLKNRQIKFTLALPDRNADQFKYTPARQHVRTPAQQADAYEQAVRQKWRALALVIKAKLEAVDAGISTVEDEFLSWTMLPDGSTAGEWLQPQMDEAYRTAKMPALLPGLPEPKRLRALDSGA